MKKLTLLCCFSIIYSLVFAQTQPKPYGALPSKRQLSWQETEMYCIVHFSMATYTDKEWGYGSEDPKIFNPSNFSALNIVSVAKAGGFKGIVVVAKHHDGFCLWPTKTTDHNISASSYKDGKGDIVKEYQMACKQLGLKLGLYCSPWDRNNELYGQPEYVTEVYRKQLIELYANYGPLFMSWHDGANGGDGYYGGAKEVRKIDRSTYYGWDTNWGITRTMQPGANIFGDVGPDVRWVGNEEGHAGETYWATYTPHAPDLGKTPANGYVKDEEGTEGTHNGKYWMPAECDVPLRAGWFYHQSQDGQSKSAYTLLDLYYKSVGRGACLDLGLSPDKNGELTNEDVTILKNFGRVLKETFAMNLARGAEFTASNIRGNSKRFGPAYLVDNDRYSYWATDDAVTTAALTADLGEKKTFNVIRLRENIKLGQRITSFAIDVYKDGKWQPTANATTIGANRLIRLPQNITTNKVRLRITGSDASITLSDFGLFKEPTHLTAPVISRDKSGMIDINTTAPVESIHYTLDGTKPGLHSALYNKPFSLINGGTVKARSFEEAGEASEVITQQLGLSKLGWKIMASNIQNNGRSKPENAIDDDAKTIWSTLQKDSSATTQLPQDISIDMGKTHTIKAFKYLPRQDKRTEGIADRYVFYSSEDGTNWKKVAEGEFANIKSNPIEQDVPLSNPITTRYFKFSVLHVANGNGVTVAEIGIKVN